MLSDFVALLAVSSFLEKFLIGFFALFISFLTARPDSVSRLHSFGVIFLFSLIAVGVVSGHSFTLLLLPVYLWILILMVGCVAVLSQAPRSLWIIELAAIGLFEGSSYFGYFECMNNFDLWKNVNAPSVAFLPMELWIVVLGAVGLCPQF